MIYFKNTDDDILNYLSINAYEWAYYCATNNCYYTVYSIEEDNEQTINIDKNKLYTSWSKYLWTRLYLTCYEVQTYIKSDTHKLVYLPKYDCYQWAANKDLRGEYVQN